jgi:RNA polymerase sigma-70 factor (ECF subfamily)
MAAASSSNASGSTPDQNRDGSTSGEALTDEALARQYRLSGERRLLGELFQRHLQGLLALAYRYLRDAESARDLVMQVFEKLIVVLREQDLERVKPWLYQVTRNEALMQLRREKRQKSRAEAYEAEFQAQKSRERVESAQAEHLVGEGPDAAQHARLQALQEALQGLKPEQQRCVTLFYLQGKSYQQVAEATGWPLKSVKSHIQNGKRNLKLAMSKPSA